MFSSRDCAEECAKVAITTVAATANTDENDFHKSFFMWPSYCGWLPESPAAWLKARRSKVAELGRLSLGRRTFLRSSIAAPALAPGLGRAQSLENVDLLLDWKAAPTYAGFYIAREIGAFRNRGV